jgi:SAM-dependent methyltransferase
MTSPGELDPERPRLGGGRRVPRQLVRHPDRLRWNARYEGGFEPSFDPHPLVVQALSLGLPGGPVADLACGISGNALFAAAAGRQVTGVDISEVALERLAQEARRRGLGDMITLIQADVETWRPQPGSYALVLCIGYWDRDVFTVAADAVSPGGVLAWQAFTAEARRVRDDLPARWCLGPGEPASLLRGGFAVLSQHDMSGDRHGTTRRLLARREV